jgi:hypothetical protein
LLLALLISYFKLARSDVLNVMILPIDRDQAAARHYFDQSKMQKNVPIIHRTIPYRLSIGYVLKYKQVTLSAFNTCSTFNIPGSVQQ